MTKDHNIDKTDCAVARSSLRAVYVESTKASAAFLIFLFVLIYIFYRFKKENHLEFSFDDFQHIFVSYLECIIADAEKDKDDKVYDT